MSSPHFVRSITAGLAALLLVTAVPRAADAQARPRPAVNASHTPSGPVVAVGGTWGPRYVFYGGYYPWAGYGYGPGWAYPYGWAPYAWGYPFAIGFGFSWGYGHGFYGPYAAFGYPGYGYPAYGYPAYGYPPYGYAADGSVRVDVAQRDAEVFIDGYRAGIVDDFDGTFQRLHAAPGGHEITVYLKGYRTVHESVYLSPTSSRTLRFSMEPLGPGETAELPPPPAPRVETREHLSERDREVRPQPLEQQPAHPPAREAVVRFGSLSLVMQPADAAFFIDGEQWVTTSTNPQGRTVIKLAEGRHTIEVKKAGFATYTETVLIRDGATLTLNVVLSK